MKYYNYIDFMFEKEVIYFNFSFIYINDSSAKTSTVWQTDLRKGIWKHLDKLNILILDYSDINTVYDKCFIGLISKDIQIFFEIGMNALDTIPSSHQNLCNVSLQEYKSDSKHILGICSDSCS